MKSSSLSARFVLLVGALAPFAAANCVSSGNNAGPTSDSGAPDFDSGPPVEIEASADASVTPDANDSGVTTEAAAPDAAAARDAGADAPPADTGVGPDAGSDAGPIGTMYYVDAVNGLDTNAGTAASPFQSIATAATAIDQSDAGAGPFTVSLASGTYSASNQKTMTVEFHNFPVAVVAPATGGTIILGKGITALGGEALTFDHGGAVQNVTFQGTEFGVEATSGTFDVKGCSFNAAGHGGYFAAFVGNTVGTFDTTGAATITNVTQASLGSIYVDNTASVTWVGGGTTTVTAPSPVGSLIFMRSAAHLSVSGVSVSSYANYVAVLYDQASLVVNDSTFTGSGQSTGGAGPGEGGAIWLGGSQNGAPSPALTLTNTSVTSSNASAVFVSTTTNTAAVNMTFTNAHLDGNKSAGVWVLGNTNPALAVNLTATQTTFDNNAFFGISSPRGTISLSGTGSSVSGNGAGASASGYTPGGVFLTDAASVSSLTMRAVAVGGNTGNQIGFAGTSASTLDLGTLTTAGNVTFSGVGAASAAVNLSAAIAGLAIGDTWLPSVQAADTAGHYPASTVLTGPVTGQNVTLATGASLNVSQ